MDFGNQKVDQLLYRKHSSCPHAPGLPSAAPGRQATAALSLPAHAAFRPALPPYTHPYSCQLRYAQTDSITPKGGGTCIVAKLVDGHLVMATINKDPET